MENKCKRCEILLDVICINPICIGHKNENIGGICYYCATNQRESLLHINEFQSFLSSSLNDIDCDSDYEDMQL